MMNERRVHRQQFVAMLFISLLLLALVLLASVTAKTANASISKSVPQKIQLEKVSMVNQRMGWAVEKDRTRVFFTSHGILHWTNVTPVGLNLPVNDQTNALTAYNFLDARHAYLGVLQNGVTSLLRTQDSGKTWTTLNFNFSPLIDIDIYQITFLDSMHGWMAFDKSHGFGKYQVVLMSTSDGGKIWQQLFDMTQNASSGFPDRGFKTFHFINVQEGWVTGPEDATTNARLYQTFDGGKTWSRFPLPALPNPPYSVSSGPYFTSASDGTLPVTYASPQGTTYYLLTYRTHDGGKTWLAAGPVLQTTATTEWNTLTFRNAEQGWVIGLDINRTPVIHRTIDGGRTWTTLYPTGLQSFTEVILDLNFLTATQGTTIDKANDGTQTLFQTNDAGQHWYALQPLLS